MLLSETAEGVDYLVSSEIEGPILGLRVRDIEEGEVIVANSRVWVIDHIGRGRTDANLLLAPLAFESLTICKCQGRFIGIASLEVIVVPRLCLIPKHTVSIDHRIGIVIVDKATSIGDKFSFTARLTKAWNETGVPN